MRTTLQLQLTTYTLANAQTHKTNVSLYTVNVVITQGSQSISGKESVVQYSGKFGKLTLFEHLAKFNFGELIDQPIGYYTF